MRDAQHPAGPVPGRGATTPAEIPARGWWDILKRTAQKFGENELMSEAASVTFFALLSIFPAIAALISLYGLVADPRTISEHLDTAAGFLPGGGLDIIREQVKRLTENPASSLGFGVILGIGTAVWSANQGSKALFERVEQSSTARKTRSAPTWCFVTRRETLGLHVRARSSSSSRLMIAVVVHAASSLDCVRTSSAFDATFWYGSAAMAGVSGPRSAVFLSSLYRVRSEPRELGEVALGDARRQRGRRRSPGSACLSPSPGTSTHFGSFDKTYGSLGAVVGFMTWIWLSTTVILLGAQLNAEMEVQTEKDTTVGSAKPVGARGATQADRTV